MKLSTMAIAATLALPQASFAVQACRSSLDASNRSLNVLADSAAIHDEFSSGWQAAGGLVLVEVRYDSVYRLAAVNTHAIGLSEDLRERISASFLVHHRETESDHREEVIVFDRGDGLSLFLVDGVERCAPRATNRVAVRRRLIELTEDFDRFERRKFEMALWLLVDADGSIRETRVARSTGRFGLDQVAVQVARELEFEPGLIEGIPHAAWVRFPMSWAAGG